MSKIDKEWKELTNFMIGKRIKKIEAWGNDDDLMPTFIFDNGDIVEFHLVNERLGGALQTKKEINN